MVTRAPGGLVAERIARESGQLQGGGARFVTPAPPHSRPAERDGLAPA